MVYLDHQDYLVPQDQRDHKATQVIVESKACQVQLAPLDLQVCVTHIAGLVQ